jgi:DNA-binding protein HU-beta
MTATKKSVTKKKSAKKSSARKTSPKRASTKTKRVQKATDRKASTKRSASKKASTKKTSAKKTSAKKASAKKTTAKKKSAKKRSGKSPASKAGVTKRSTAKKTTAKKAKTKKGSAAKKATAKKGSSKRAKAKKAKARPPRSKAKAKVVTAVESGTAGNLENLDSIIDADLLENFEGWETPAGTSSTQPARGTEGGGMRAEREADFDELLEGEKDNEDWSSTGVFESDTAVEGVLNEAVEENVTVTSLVVVQEAKLAPVQECRIEQPVPDQEREFEEFAAEEIISILDESLAMDLEATAQAEPKDAEPQTQEAPPPPQALEDEVEAVQPPAATSQRSFLSRLWRLLISSN